MKERGLALDTDLYQLTMLKGYFASGMEGPAVFEFFVRRLPAGRNFLMAAGLEQVLEYLEGFEFEPGELDWVSTQPGLGRALADRLRAMRFTGDVEAMPEGTLFFADEPILRVVAPMPEAQFVESRIINLLHYQTLVASKAARSVLVAGGRALVDFGFRRAHGAEAGLLSARASYLAGFDGTATVSAGQRFGIPLFGTVAHSFIQAHKREDEAFLHFALANRENAVFLVDTYDNEAATAKVVEMAAGLRREGIEPRGIRLDSGDLAEHARRARRILDAGGLPHARIVASGNLDEFRVRELVDAAAPIDSFGVGTRMNTSADHPYLDCAYKLQEYAGRPCRKRSEGKATWPGRKQVWRRYDADGRMTGDLLTLVGEEGEGVPLLVPVMRAGRRVLPRRSLAEARRHAAAELERLPPERRRLEPAGDYPVRVDTALERLAQKVDAS